MRKLILLFVLYLTFATAGGMNTCEVGETVGEVLAFTGTHLRVVGEPLTSAGGSDVWVEIGDAPIYDLWTGFCQDVSSIKIGMSARVAYVGNKALAVWLNYGRGDSAVLSVVVSDNIQYGADFAVFLSGDGKYRVVLTSETVIIDPGVGEISVLDVLPKQEFFVWVDMITASSPSLVYPDKVVLIYD